MAVNGISVGKDYSFGLYDATTGVLVDLGIVEGVQITANKHDIKAMPYNDDPLYGYIPDGYKISGTLVRTNANLENLALDLNTIFSQGGSTKSGYFNETVNNGDGTTSRYQYTGVVWFLTDVADVSREKNVRQKIEMMASSKKRIA